MNKAQIGRLGEQLSVQYLINQSYCILDTNFNVGKIGEIDIIAKKDNCICFIEVKSRTSKNFGYAVEAVGYKKQRKIHIISQIYIKSKSLYNQNIRFDVIEVYLEKYYDTYKLIEINHIISAF